MLGSKFRRAPSARSPGTIPSKSTQAHAMLATTPTRSLTPRNSRGTTSDASATPRQHSFALTATRGSPVMSTSLNFVVDFINTHHASLSAFAQKVDSNDLKFSDGPGKALCEHANRLKAVLTKAQCLEAALMKETDEVGKREQGYIAEVNNFKAQLEDQQRKTVDANNLAEQHVKTTKLHQEKIQDLEVKYQDLQKDAHGLREQLEDREATILTLQKDCIARLAEYMEQQSRHSSEDISNSVRTLLEQQPHVTLAEISSSVKDALAQQARLSLANISSELKQTLTDMQNTVTPILSEINDTLSRDPTTSFTLQDLQAELGRREEALLGKVYASVGAAIKEQSSGTSDGIRDAHKQVNDGLPKIMSAPRQELSRKAESDMEKIREDAIKNDGRRPMPIPTLTQGYTMNDRAIEGVEAPLQLYPISVVCSGSIDDTPPPSQRSHLPQISGEANTSNSLRPKSKIDDIEHKARQEAKRPFQNESPPGSAMTRLRQQPPSPSKDGFRRPTTRNIKDFYYISREDWDARVRSNNKNDKDYLRQYHYAGLIMETDAGVDREPPCSKCQEVGVKCKAFGPGLKNPSNTDTCARCRIFKGGRCNTKVHTLTGAGDEQEWISKADFETMKAEMQRYVAIQANQFEQQ